MIAELLPAEVAAEETIGEDPGAYLFPAEQELVAKAVPKRQREVTYARSAARRALARLGQPAVPILRGERGAPVWPAGIVGSMTHTKGYYAAAVADADKIRSVGIDAEEHGVLPDGVLGQIALPDEQTMLRGLPDGSVHWDRLLFSAKETVYKAWFPLTRRWLGFEDARLVLDPDGDSASGTFTATILIDPTALAGPPLRGFTGRFLARDGYVLTAIAVLHA